MNFLYYPSASLKTEESFCFSSPLCSYFRTFHPSLNESFNGCFLLSGWCLTFNLAWYIRLIGLLSQLISIPFFKWNLCLGFLKVALTSHSLLPLHCDISLPVTPGYLLLALYDAIQGPSPLRSLIYRAFLILPVTESGAGFLRAIVPYAFFSIVFELSLSSLVKS